MVFKLLAIILAISSLSQETLTLPFLCPVNITNDNINCSIDSNDYTISRPSPASVKVVEYNVDRNGYGGDSPFESGIEAIISIFKSNGKKREKK